MSTVRSEKKAARGAGTLVERVSEAIRQAIASGAFRPGDKLPSEARLTTEHGVSRTVVREAVAALRSEGLLEARQGAGVFVLDAAPEPVLPFQFLDNAAISSIIELLELRTAVEVEAAGLAAVRRSPANEEAIFKAFHAFQSAIETGEPTIEADWALHLAIAQATNNPRFPEFLQMLGSRSIPRTALQGAEGESAARAYLDRIQEEHGAIVSAIADGDEKEARDAMRRHLKGSQTRYRNLLRSRAA